MDSRSGGADLSIGVRILDCDHREMSETLTEIETAIARGEDRGRTSELLRKLAHFTGSHFALEESMMEATKYPRIALHRHNHRRLMGQIKEIVLRHTRDRLALNFDALEFLSAWHGNHVEEDDLHYGLWLNGTELR